MALYCPPSHTLRGLFFFPLFWFSPVFCRNQCRGMCVCRGGWGGGGNKWNIKTPVSLTLSTCPRGADGQKAPSAVHLSPVTRTAKPSSHRAHRADTPKGVRGSWAAWLAAAAVLEESMEHVKPQPVSPGVLHGWTGLTFSDTGGCIDPQPSHERLSSVNDREKERSIAQCACCL